MVFAFADCSKYYLPIKSTVFLTPSPTDIIMESPSPISGKCLSICNNNIFASQTYEKLTIDTVDSINKTNLTNTAKHPGQAVKIITDDTGEHTVVKEGSEVCKSTQKKIRSFEGAQCTVKNSNCDENLIKFVFTKHGVQIISDKESIV